MAIQNESKNLPDTGFSNHCTIIGGPIKEKSGQTSYI